MRTGTMTRPPPMPRKDEAKPAARPRQTSRTCRAAVTRASLADTISRGKSHSRKGLRCSAALPLKAPGRPQEGEDQGFSRPHATFARAIRLNAGEYIPGAGLGPVPGNRKEDPEEPRTLSFPGGSPYSLYDV